MPDYLLQPPLESVGPDYNIYHYTDGIYKIVNFKSTRLRIAPPVRTGVTKNENKLVQSLSRSRRVVLEYALCNDWAYFCTFTLDPNKYNRDDLPKFHKDFTQFIRDMRKKYIKFGFDSKLSFVFVPEEHKDGSSLFEIIGSLIDFVFSLFEGLLTLGELLANFLTNLPTYIGFLPGSVVTVVVSIFGIVVLFKTLGRD